MVIGLATAAIQMGLALPTGFLFGVGYGTGVRIGYEQVYPLLFPKGQRNTTSELAATMKGMNTVYDAIGGKDASRMGIAVGITNAGEILNNPDFQVLNQLESSSSGLTSSSSSQSRYGLDNLSSPPPDTSFRDTSPQFNSLYNAISTMQLSQVIIAYGEATNYKNGFTKSQNDELLIPALRTRLSFLRSPDTIQQPIVNTVPIKPPAPKREATTKEQEYNTWAAELSTQQNIYLKNKNQIGIYKRSGKSPTFYKENTRFMQAAILIIRNKSNDYRSPNDTIRRHALRLRQEIGNGNWT